MEYNKIVTFDAAKTYFKTLWRPMQSECILNNLKKILEFLKSPAQEVCFVNMLEKYLPFYYMIFMDDEFLETTVLTDECKVFANEILRTLEANRNSFNWEISFSREIAGIPVIFRKVYTYPCDAYTQEQYDRQICSKFKETWVKTTLKFIKSPHLSLKYPEMHKQEAQYIYRGILKQNEEDLGPNSLWAPVWEALNIFKLKYEYIVSLHPTDLDYLKFVHFEKANIRKKNYILRDENAFTQLENSESRTVADDTSNSECKKSNYQKPDNKLVVPALNHNELIKSLLEMKVTNTDTIVYTLKVNEPNLATGTVKEFHNDINQSSNDNITNASSLCVNKVVLPVDDVDQMVGDIVTIEENTNKGVSNMQYTDSVNKYKVELLQKNPLIIENVSIYERQILNDDTNMVDLIDFDYVEDVGAIDTSENTVEIANNFQEDATTDFKATEFLQKNPVLTDNLSNYETDILSRDINMADLVDFDYVEDFGEIDTSKNTVELVNNFRKDAAQDDKLTDVTYSIKSVVHDKVESQVIESNNDANITFGHNISIIVGDKNTSTPTRTDETNLVTANPFLQQITKLHQVNRPLFIKEKDFVSNDNFSKSEDVVYDNEAINNEIGDSENESTDTNDNLSEIMSDKLNLKKKSVKPPPSAKAQKRKEAKVQRRFEKKINRKRRLLNSVPIQFIIKSFKAILDFLNDDFRATMEMVSLNILESNVLKKIHGLAPKMIPLEAIFSDSCLDLAIQLFDHLARCNYSLQVECVKPFLVKENKSFNDVGMRQRTVRFTKIPYRKYKNIRKAQLMEMCSMSPVNTGSSPVRSTWSQQQHEVSRSPSASPSRFKQQKSSPELDESQRYYYDACVEETQPMPCGAFTAKLNVNPAVAMKAKLLEGLAVPLESDKAMRMMRLMGWNGGALGVRGDGLIEPLQPQLDVPKGVGLGHQKLISTKIKTSRLQKRFKLGETISPKITDTFEIDTDGSAKTLGNNVREKNNNVITQSRNEYDNKPGSLNDKLDFAKPKPHQINIDDSIVADNKTIRTDSEDISGDNANAWMVKSYENADGSSWLTNETLLQKCKDRLTNTSSKASNVGTVNAKIETNSIDNVKGKSTLSSNKTLIQKNIDTVRVNHEKLMNSLQTRKNEEQLNEADDKLDPYTREGRRRYLSDRIKFLVHLLDFLQSYEKKNTYVSYEKKPTEENVEFISSTIWSLNKRVVTASKLSREATIMGACAREMEAHADLFLACRFKKRLLLIVKSEGPIDPLLLNEPDEVEYELEHTHTVNDYLTYCRLPVEAKRGVQTKILTNRIILDFLNSGDRVRVYDYGQACRGVRMYVISLISMLNRQMAHYQLGLGSSEHCYFRRMLNRMEGFCLVYRFNSDASFFSSLQLEKVDLTKRCRVCQLTNQCISSSYPVDNSQFDGQFAETNNDVELYPNIFNNRKDDLTFNINNGVTTSVAATELNTEQVSNNETCNTDLANDKYLIGEDWLHSNENIETSAKDESHNMSLNTDAMGFNTDVRSESNVQNITLREIPVSKRCDTEDTDENCVTVNTSHEQRSLEPNNWCKRIKIDETNNDERCHLVYETFHKDIRKRKACCMEQDADNENTEVIKLNSEFTTNKVIASKLSNVDVAACNWPKNILVVHYNYPSTEIDASSAMALQTIIYEAMNKEMYLPRLKCYGLKSGGIIYTCYDQKSYIWLREELQWFYKLLDYKQDLDTTHIIAMKITSFINVDIDIIFNNIEAFYENIKTDSWKVIQTKTFAGYCTITIEVDDCSLKNIRKEAYGLFVGIDKAEISVIYDLDLI